MSPVPPLSGAARLRIAVRSTRLLALLIVCLALHYAWRLARRRSPWPRRFLGAVARIVGARVRIVGLPLSRDVLFVCNHSSWIDILLIAGATGTAFVSKAELETAPLVGWLAGLNHTIYVKREDRRGMHGQITAIRAALLRGPLTIFPEGTTGDGATLLPFKASLLQVLDPPPPGIRLQPLFLDYGAAATQIAWHDEDGRSNVLRLLGRRGTIPATLYCLDPIDPGTVGDRKMLAAAARASLAAAIAASGSAMRA